MFDYTHNLTIYFKDSIYPYKYDKFSFTMPVFTDKYKNNYLLYDHLHSMGIELEQDDFITVKLVDGHDDEHLVIPFGPKAQEYLSEWLSEHHYQREDYEITEKDSEDKEVK